MNYIDGLPVSVYFIIIGITLIVSISILIYRYQRKPEEEKVNNTPLEIKTRYCSNCGTKNKDNDKYCENCGSNLFGLNNYCGNCGTKIHSDDKYCPNCGSKI